MAAITIKDLHMNRVLDRNAMSFVRGGNGSWVFGWIKPFVEARPSFGTVFNFYQINYIADQMNNQIQMVDVNNTAPNSVISIALSEDAANNKSQ